VRCLRIFGCKAVLRTPLAAKAKAVVTPRQLVRSRSRHRRDRLAAPLQSYIQGQGAAAGRESADCVRTAKSVELKAPIGPF